LHRKLVTEFFLEVGTTVNLVTIDIASSSSTRSDEKATENHAYSHHIPLTRLAEAA
jgi:hypothetical protein